MGTIPGASARQSIAEWSTRPYGFIAVCTKMFDGRDDQEIIRLSMQSVSMLPSCRPVAGYLAGERRVIWAPDAACGDVDELGASLCGLHGADGPIAAGSVAWTWALALCDAGAFTGYLVVAAPTRPADDEYHALRALACQTGAALSNAASRRRGGGEEQERQVRELSDESSVMAATLSGLRRERAMEEALTAVFLSGEGEADTARVLAEVTGLAVVVEDRFGNVQARADAEPPGEAVPNRPGGRDETRRDEVLRRAVREHRVVRDRTRLMAVAQSRNEILAVLVLLDPDGRAGPHETYALQHAAGLLATQLAHRRDLAKVELRLRRNVVDDLISGMDPVDAYARCGAIGHDLYRPHHVSAMLWRGDVSVDALVQAAGRAAAMLGLAALSTSRAGAVVMITDGRPGGPPLHQALARELGSPTGAIGIGGRCDHPGDFPRSYREATRALRIRQRSRLPDGATAFDELGILRIVGADDDGPLEAFVREWLGRLLDYDLRHGCDLVGTLAEYLDCGGNYDTAAAALMVHRSTLRYRLQRIREIANVDLHNPDQRLNLHIAARAWKTLDRGDLPADSA